MSVVNYGLILIECIVSMFQGRELYFLFITTQFFGLVGGLLIKENVIFHKTNEITTTGAKWLVSTVVDLTPFDNYLLKVSKDIQTARDTVSAILEKYTADQYSIYAKTFQSMSKEVAYLQKLRSNLGASYQDYSLFRRRNKRRLSRVQ